MAGLYDLGMQLVGRQFAAGLLAVALSSAMVAQDRDWYCPAVPGLRNGSPAWEKWFVGTIGGVSARMHLIGAGDVAKGEFYTQDDWKPVSLGGRMSAGRKLLLHEERESNCGVRGECDGPGMLRGTVTKVGLTGPGRPHPTISRTTYDWPLSLHQNAESKGRDASSERQRGR